jgi:hypothetical protein
MTRAQGICALRSSAARSSNPAEHASASSECLGLLSDGAFERGCICCTTADQQCTSSLRQAPSPPARALPVKDSAHVALHDTFMQLTLQMVHRKESWLRPIHWRQRHRRRRCRHQSRFPTRRTPVSVLAKSSRPGDAFSPAAFHCFPLKSRGNVRSVAPAAMPMATRIWAAA